jgi:hypothetical protein
MDQPSETSAHTILDPKIRKYADFYSTLGFVGYVIRGLLQHIDATSHDHYRPLSPETCRVVKLPKTGENT